MTIEKKLENSEQAVFINKSGSRINARSVQNILKKMSSKMGLPFVNPHVETLFCVAHIGIEWRFTRSSGVARTRQFIDNTNLHQIRFSTLGKVYDNSHPHAKGD